MKKLVFSTFVVLFTAVSFAQTKVGTVDADYILSQMPELAQAQEALKTYNLDLEAQLKTKMTNYETVVKAAEANFKTMTDAEKIAKQEEVVGLEDDINKFRTNGSQLVQMKQNDLLRPLYKKIGDQVNTYAKANGYTQIINTTGSNNTLAYLDPAYDITLVVLTQMGITVKQD